MSTRTSSSRTKACAESNCSLASSSALTASNAGDFAKRTVRRTCFASTKPVGSNTQGMSLPAKIKGAVMYSASRSVRSRLVVSISANCSFTGTRSPNASWNADFSGSVGSSRSTQAEFLSDAPCGKVLGVGAEHGGSSVRGLRRMHVHGRAPLRYPFRHDLFRHDLDASEKAPPQPGAEADQSEATASTDAGRRSHRTTRLCARHRQLFSRFFQIMWSFVRLSS